MRTDLENDLKDLFTEMVSDEPPLSSPVMARSTARGSAKRGSTWTFTAHSALRGALARGFATAGLAGAVAVGAVVAPRIIENTPPAAPSATEPGTAPSKRPTPSRGGPVAIAPPAKSDPSTDHETPGAGTPGIEKTTDPAAASSAEPTNDPAIGPDPKATPEPTKEPTPATNPSADCSTRGSGSIKATTACDAALETALRFAEARIDKSSADLWLSSSAKGRYDRHDTGLWLYAPAGERAYEAYVVTERTHTSEGIRFTIEMHQGYIGKNADRLRVEHVVIAESANHKGYATPNAMAVVNATLIAGPGAA